ncbi:unnamed protein product [Rotaria magnacalcarata]|uniref:Cytochrome b561 domain-containing protein n=1 Tax=Rotaria magnacalcarata TaxID=392030 RepID=A0A819C5F4_9BILA|nr:unnamed protein product [Rotaria magnacalcarata]CAF2140495.1 unnamed protein product [Rotaria magnacalcarata]CAF3805982.1 unnamed protein product [Rotaria magnacalcarata]CAF4136293.1 unnamed protein product [Rotaria magnacalcarata]
MVISRDDAVQTVVEDNTFEYAHGTVMIFAWMVFASTAILFARYGRAIRFGSKDKFFGEKNWFQIHRLLACLTSVITLLGFFLILVQTNAEWVGVDEGQTFVHSVLGAIIVCCALWQAWMALFRCHPDGSHRFIFNWLHRLTGSLAFFLSIPAIFIIVEQLGKNRTGMIIILSLWSIWVVCIVIILEVIQFFFRKISKKAVSQRYETEPSRTRAENDDGSATKSWNNLLLVLFSLHFVISIALAIPLVVLIWN